MKILYPDYHNCIANLACSIINHYGVIPINNTLPLADKFLKKEYKNVVVLLLDGMGKNIIESNLSADGFFRSNLKGIYSSTFPPTTVAATTAINSGLYPNQSAWLGWTGYFKEVDKNIVYFSNVDNDTGEQVADFNVPWTYCPYINICDTIKANGALAYSVTPFSEPFPQTYEDICNQIKRLCKLNGRKYIYSYWYEPDGIMHRTGCFSKKSKKALKEIEALTEKLADELEDTLFIITADHGHINSKSAFITDYPNIMECLERLPSIEPRALNLFVKDGMKESFEKAFNSHFGDKFMLMTKEKAIETQIFGTGKNHDRLNEMLGDYVAIAIDDLTIYNSTSEKFIGVHAGLTEDEMQIPFIVIEKEV